MNIAEEKKPYIISMTDEAQIATVDGWAKHIGMTRTKAVTAACMLAFKYENMRIENELLKRRLEIAEAGKLSASQNDELERLLRSILR